jgi:ubiquinone/menaquinone biosynthesis C-methylase UbiE
LAKNTYDSSTAVAFWGARERDLASLDSWREVLTPYLQEADPLPILDLGAGTGTFAWALTAWFDRSVVAVEPSAPMRQIAQQRTPNPRVAYVGGQAEHLPFGGRAFGAAWLSTVIHHLPDMSRCAGELSRVLRPGSPVLIRNAFAGRLDRINLFQYFPAAKRVAMSFPTVEETVQAFGSLGFAFDALRPVPQVSASSLSEFCHRLPTLYRADTTMKALTQAEFHAGLQLVEDDIAAGNGATSVVDWLDLLVLRNSETNVA